MSNIKRVIICVVCLVLAFTFAGCNNNNSDKMVDKAAKAVSDFYEEQYNESGYNDKHLEIVNTRIVHIKDDSGLKTASGEDISLGKIDCIVYFELLTNAENTAPYYVNEHKSVVFYRDGETEVTEDIFVESEYKASVIEQLIDKIENFGDRYNRKIRV